MLDACRCAALLLTALSAAWATPIEIAASGHRADLQRAVDALGDGGGVVIVPPGAWPLEGTINLHADGITLLGLGPRNTRLYREGESDAPFFDLRGARDLRISGLHLEGSAAPGSSALERGVEVTGVEGFRVDDCVLERLGNSGVLTHASWGVVDHNEIRDGFKEAIGNFGYGVAVDGDPAYSGLPFGDADAVFIEDNLITGARHAVASNRGARYVFRYNHVTQNEHSHAIDTHGDEYNGELGVGTEWAEIYGNRVEEPVYRSSAVLLRGGAGVIWGNTLLGYPTAVRLTEQTPQPTGMVHVWGNEFEGQLIDPAASDPTPGLEANGRPDFVLAPPEGYTPFAYPHPRAATLIADAGPDQRLAAFEVGGRPELILDGAGSTSVIGAVAGWRWSLDGVEISTCARDALPLEAPGVHTLLLEVEAPTGERAYDAALVEVQPAGPLRSTPAWASRGIRPILGAARLTFTLAPSLDLQDAYVTLAGPRDIAGHEDNAILIRTNPDGRFDVRDGGTYAALAEIPYEAGRAHEVEIEVDLEAQRYSAWIDGQRLAEGFEFRRAEARLTQVTAWHATGDLTLDALRVEGTLMEIDPACAPPPVEDAGLPEDAGPPQDAAPPRDINLPTDMSVDAQPAVDAGAPRDAAPPRDAPRRDDAAHVDDAARLDDAAPPPFDVATPDEGAWASDAEVSAPSSTSMVGEEGCAVGGRAAPPGLLLGLLGLLVLRARRRGPPGGSPPGI